MNYARHNVKRHGNHDVHDPEPALVQWHVLFSMIGKAKAKGRIDTLLKDGVRECGRTLALDEWRN